MSHPQVIYLVCCFCSWRAGSHVNPLNPERILPLCSKWRWRSWILIPATIQIFSIQPYFFGTKIAYFYLSTTSMVLQIDVSSFQIHRSWTLQALVCCTTWRHFVEVAFGLWSFNADFFSNDFGKKRNGARGHEFPGRGSVTCRFKADKADCTKTYSNLRES